MTKKEFKEKSKAEKSVGYRLTLCGEIFAAIGLVIVAAGLFFVPAFAAQIACYAGGGAAAIVGIILNLAGERMLSKSYKEHVGK